MPLVRMTHAPYVGPGCGSEGRNKKLAHALPELFVQNSRKLGLDEDTPATAVQVTHHEFTVDDVNTPELWLEICFTEEPPSKTRQMAVRNYLERILSDWFDQNQLSQPDIAVDIFWGPGRGFYRIQGEYQEW